MWLHIEIGLLEWIAYEEAVVQIGGSGATVRGHIFGGGLLNMLKSFVMGFPFGSSTIFPLGLSLSELFGFHKCTN